VGRGPRERVHSWMSRSSAPGRGPALLQAHGGPRRRSGCTLDGLHQVLVGVLLHRQSDPGSRGWRGIEDGVALKSCARFMRHVLDGDEKVQPGGEAGAGSGHHRGGHVDDGQLRDRQPLLFQVVLRLQEATSTRARSPAGGRGARIHRQGRDEGRQGARKWSSVNSRWPVQVPGPQHAMPCRASSGSMLAWKSTCWRRARAWMRPETCSSTCRGSGRPAPGS